MRWVQALGVAVVTMIAVVAAAMALMWGLQVAPVPTTVIVLGVLTTMLTMAIYLELGR